ncbi:MAG: hypothetical protein H7Z17_14315, partial [Fuerstia sp.]|nr:hypothetical protein [Fuerstiella sp.]
MQFSKCGFLLTVFALSASIGCGGADSGSTDVDADLMSELLGPEEESQDASEASHEGSDDDVVAESDSADVRTVSKSLKRQPAAKGRTAPVGEKLELRLRKGDRFPLVKTVEQRLEQKSDVVPAMARTKLELTLIITVEDVKSDAILLGVQYSRVAYQHDINGQQLSYDSASHRGAVPWDAIPYAGMVNNGFAFWLGRNNSIRELVGYRDFLERCVANVPIERRETLLSEISNRFGDDGVANFVDDSIGLLPYDSTVDEAAATRVMPGDLWTRERRLMQPVPIHLTSTYRLVSLDENTADIEITGRVAAGEAGAPSDVGRLRIIGGQSIGHCLVDRATGLPLEMNLSRFMKMQLTTSDNQKVIQEKQIETTIKSFPEMRGVTAGVQPPESAIQQTSGFRN